MHFASLFGVLARGQEARVQEIGLCVGTRRRVCREVDRLHELMLTENERVWVGTKVRPGIQRRVVDRESGQRIFPAADERMMKEVMQAGCE